MEDGVHGESEKVVHERVQGRGGEADSEQRQERRRRVARAWADRDERAGLGEESGDRREKGPAGAADERGAGGATRLRRELKTVTMERDFLRKAAAFLARS